MSIEEDFSLEEYKALREEILRKMENCIKILSLGVGGITVIMGFVYEYNTNNDLFLVLPFLIFANIYIYKAEAKSIVNAGKYICKLENAYYRGNINSTKCDPDKIFGNLGWEKWLREEKKIKLYIRHAFAADLILGSLYVLCLSKLWKWTTHFSVITILRTIFSTSPSMAILYAILFIIIPLFWLFLIFDGIKDHL